MDTRPSIHNLTGRQVEAFAIMGRPSKDLPGQDLSKRCWAQASDDPMGFKVYLVISSILTKTERQECLKLVRQEIKRRKWTSVIMLEQN